VTARQRGKIRSQLEKHRKRDELIAIRREPLDPSWTLAFVVGLGDELMLLRDVSDLWPDGFKVVRIRDVSRIARRAGEKWCQHMLSSERLVKTKKPPFHVELAGWKSAAESISRHVSCLIIEDENPDDDRFVLGNVRRLGVKALSIRPLEPSGIWALDDVTFPYPRITAVTFDDRYSRLFGKYAPSSESRK